MRRFPYDLHVQTRGCERITALLFEDEASKPLLIAQGAITLVLAAMDQFPNDSSLQGEAAYVLGIMASNDLAMKEELTRLGVRERLLALLSKFEAVKNVQVRKAARMMPLMTSL
jgi:hypothetical protein